MQQRCHLVIKVANWFNGYARAITTQYYVTPLHLSIKPVTSCTITLRASLYVCSEDTVFTGATRYTTLIPHCGPERQHKKKTNTLITMGTSAKFRLCKSVLNMKYTFSWVILVNVPPKCCKNNYCFISAADLHSLPGTNWSPVGSFCLVTHIPALSSEVSIAVRIILVKNKK